MIGIGKINEIINRGEYSELIVGKYCIKIDNDYVDKVREFNLVFFKEGKPYIKTNSESVKFINLARYLLNLPYGNKYHVRYKNNDFCDLRKDNLYTSRNIIIFDGDTVIIFTNNGDKILTDSKYYDLVSNYVWHNNKGYAHTKEVINGKRTNIYMHRLILNPSDNMVIDHIDRNGLNNKTSNLRICNMAENTRNKVVKGKFTSIYKGVFKDKYGKFVAYIKTNSKYKHIGRFTNEIAAANAHNYYAKELHKEFAKLNDAPLMSKNEWEKYKSTSRNKAVTI